MAKVLFLVSIMLLSSYLTEQSKLSHDNMIDKSDIKTNTLEDEDGEPCDIYTSLCSNNIYYSRETNSTFFIKHNFTLDNAWKSVGKPSYCRNIPCQAEYTTNIFKSTQFKYGNETFSTRSSTVGNSESISFIITSAVSSALSTMGKQLGASIDFSKQYDSERSFEVAYANGITVSYSTSTENAISSAEQKVTCFGVQNEKVLIQERTYMIRLTGTLCEYFRYSETLKMHVFKCNYVDLRMYPVHHGYYNIFGEIQCYREKINS